MGVDFLFSLFVNGRSGGDYLDPQTGKKIEIPEGKTLRSVDPEAARFYEALGDTKVTGELHNAVGDIYTQYMDIPENVVSRAEFKPLETAYRTYEANPTVAHAAAFLDEAGKVYRLAGNGGYGVDSPYAKVNAAIEAETAARQATANTKRVDRPVSLEDNNNSDTVSANKKAVAQVSYGDQYTKGKNGRKELKANVSYTTSDGYRYSTDGLGRIDGAEGTLIRGEGERNEYAQSIVGREDRLPTDDGGHLIAKIFKGSGDIDNLVPMDATLNRGDWKAMENTWKKALDEGKMVKVKIQPRYEGASNRPVSFVIKYNIEGQNMRIIEFDN